MINPQIIMQVQQMAQKGVAIKDIVYNLKTNGFTPETAEMILCEAFPPLKQAKQAIANSGMSTKQYLSQLAKQNNISIDQIGGIVTDLKKLFG